MSGRVMLIGGFDETRFLANSLLKKGYAVTAINQEQDKCERLATIERLDVYRGDGSKPFVLEDANVYNADIAIALTERDDDNLVICQLCKKKFNVKRTMAVISDPKKTEFFYRMGIDSVVCAVSTLSSVIEQQAVLDEMTTLIPVGAGRIRVSQVHLGANSPAAGKMLWEVNLPGQVIVGCIQRGEQHIIPRGVTPLLPGDLLVLISADEDETAAIRELTGK